MAIERIEPADLPQLMAQVRRTLGTDDITLYRVSSGTILAFEGDIAADQVMRTPPQALIRCKEGGVGGYEVSRNL